jgi:SAM-dependent methyltransferase
MHGEQDKLFDEYGLPRYLDIQAEIGYTKHIGGVKATRELLSLCQVNQDKVVLNVGCGAGGTTTYIVKNYGCHVVGADIKHNMAASAKKRAQKKGLSEKTEFIQADAQDLPFKGGSFDIVLCESVNTFIPDRVKAVSEYKRLVKPGGFVGLNEPVMLKTPSPAVAELIAGMVGHAILPTSVWEGLLHEVGLADIIVKTYANKMGAESRSQFGFFDLGDFVTLVSKSIKVLFKDRYTRSLIRQATASNPKEFIEYMGYSLCVGRKV